MAKNAYVLNDADVAFLRKLRLDYTSSPLGDRAADQYRNRVIVPKDTRTGTVYQEITAGSVSEAGVGSVKFDSLDTRDRSFGVAETEETTVYNYSDTVFEIGDRVFCKLDRTAYKTLSGTSETEPQNVWVVSDLSGEAEERCLYLCGSQTLAVANNDTNQQLQLVAYNNFDATTYQINAAEWSVTLLREGRYEVRHDFTLTGASAGTDNHATESATAYFRNGSTLGTSVVGCSGVLMQVTSFASELGFENAGRTWHAISPGGMTPHKIDWVVKRNTWTNGSNVNLTSARIRFLGNITPTTGIFDAPGP